MYETLIKPETPKPSKSKYFGKLLIGKDSHSKEIVSADLSKYFILS